MEKLILRKYKSFRHFVKAIKRLAKKMELEDDLSVIVKDGKSWIEFLLENGEIHYSSCNENFKLIMEAEWFGDFGKIYFYVSG